MQNDDDLLDVPQNAFIERGLRSAEEVKSTGAFSTAPLLLAKLEAKLNAYEQKRSQS